MSTDEKAKRQNVSKDQQQHSRDSEYIAKTSQSPRQRLSGVAKDNDTEASLNTTLENFRFVHINKQTY